MCGRRRGKHGPRKQAGFTLTEALTVMGILGVLFAVGAVSFGYMEGTAQRDACRDNMQAVEKQLQVYKLQYGSFPSEADYPTDRFLGNRTYFPEKPFCPLDRSHSYSYTYIPRGSVQTPVVECPISPTGHGSVDGTGGG